MPRLNNADDVRVGATQASWVYLGATQVWTPPATGPLVSDTFDRANSTSSLGTADTGQTWANLDGTMGIETNKAYATSNGSPNAAFAHLDSGALNVDITCDVVHDGDNGVIFRSVDVNNFLLARLGANKVEFYRRQTGTFTLVSEVAMTLTSGQTYAFRVVCSGSTIDVYVDAVKKLTATESFQSTATHHGLWGKVGTPRWDNFKVEAA